MALRLPTCVLGLAMLTACADTEASNAPPDDLHTESVVAYDHYLAAQNFADRRMGRDDADSALANYEAAVTADPEFAEAWAGLAQAHLWLHFNQTVPGQVEPARQAVERAEELDPDGLETRLARGYLAYWGERDFDAALTEFLAAERLAANDPDVAGAIANIYRRQGNLADAVRYYERRVELDPQRGLALVSLAQTYGATGQYDARARVAERLVALDDVRGHYNRFWAAFDVGDTVSAWAVIPEIAAAEERTEPAFFEVLQAVVRRNDADVLRIMDVSDPDDLRNWGLQREFAHALARTGQAGDRSDLIDIWVADRLDRMELTQPSETARLTREAVLRSQAGLLEAFKGDRAAALEHARAVVALDPLELDAWSGGGTLWNVAMTHLALGQNNEALELLEAIHARGLGSSSGWMDLHPAYDVIRGSARYQAMLDARRSIETAPAP